MTATELKAAFNQVIDNASAAGHDTSKIEVAREFFTNPEFKSNLEEFVWNTNRGRP